MTHDFRLYVSLDGPGEIHDQNRIFTGGKGSFETIVRNLKGLKESAPEYYAGKVMLQCVVSPGADFWKLLHFFANASDLIGPAPLLVNTVLRGPKTYFTPSLSAEFNDGLEALEKIFLQKVVKGDRNDGEFAFLRALFESAYLVIHRREVNPNGWGETFHTRCACFPGNFKLLVRADGKLLICEKCNDALEIGHVEGGLDGRKICEIYRAYHDLHANECRKCWAVHLCASCYATDTARAGTFGASLNPEDCERQRQFWTSKLRKYASVYEQDAGAFDYLSDIVSFQPRVPVLDFEPSDSNGGPGTDLAAESGRGDGAMQTVT